MLLNAISPEAAYLQWMSVQCEALVSALRMVRRQSPVTQTLDSTLRRAFLGDCKTAER